MRLIIKICVLLLWMPLAAVADPVPEYVLKATYIYNFALYTEWPANTGDILNICVLGHDGLGTAFDTIQGKQVNNVTISVNRVALSSNLKNCQILFISERETGGIQKILAILEDSPVLTVTEGNAPSINDVMIRMVVDNKRLSFDINASAAKRSRLNISSKLLRLARSVY